MTLNELMAQILDLFEALGLTVYMQAFVIITLAVALLSRLMGRGD